MTDGVVVVDKEGRVVIQNHAADRFLVDDSAGAGVFSVDGTTPVPPEQRPIPRAQRGEPVQEDLVYRLPRSQEAATVSVTANAVRGHGGSIDAIVAVFRDVTDRRKLVDALEARNKELEASEQTKSELVERLRVAVDELSTPILEVWEDVLALPVIGLVDSRRAAQIMERLLDEIVDKQAAYVIIDVTGVEVIDSKTAEHFSKLVRAVELMGARCVLTGIRPAVGQTLLDLGLELGTVTTLRNLKHALRTTLKLVDRARRDEERPPARAKHDER
jgi:rsbT co-antagonist protein RsbR